MIAKFANGFSAKAKGYAVADQLGEREPRVSSGYVFLRAELSGQVILRARTVLCKLEKELVERHARDFN
jgi:hypothetical protein